MLDKSVIADKLGSWKNGSIGNQEFFCWLIDYLVEEIDNKEDKTKIEEPEPQPE